MEEKMKVITNDIPKETYTFHKIIFINKVSFQMMPVFNIKFLNKIKLKLYYGVY